MNSDTHESPFRHLLRKSRDYVTHWTIAGATLALTGFTPDHWIADLLHYVSGSRRIELLSVFDVRVGLVAVGVALITWNTLRRTGLPKPKEFAANWSGMLGALKSADRAEENKSPFSPTIAPPPAFPDKPSIAVLPFQNMSDDAEQEYFTDGIVEDIITALSRFRTLFVIAVNRNSSFKYKGRTEDVKQFGRELGVRYILEGSVRKVGNKVRISGQLIDTMSGSHLWADRFDGLLEGIFDLQDRITSSVVGAVAPKLEEVEIERAKRKPTSSLDAYDYYLQGMASFYQLTAEGNNEALRLFYKALEIDSDFASAYGMGAWCYVHRKWHGWMTDHAREGVKAARLAHQAVETGRDDAVALASGGYALCYVGGQPDGAAFVERALSLNPNLAAAWYLSGQLRMWLGEPDAAIDHVAHAMRLSPLHPLMYGMLHTTAAAHFHAGRYEDALMWAGRALRERPDFLPSLRVVAASHALVGRMEEAREAMARIRQLDPDLHISSLKKLVPLSRQQDIAKYLDALREAGLPE